MCDEPIVDIRIESLNAELLGKTVDFIFRLMEETLPQPKGTDVLGTATQAYQEGKITKKQYIAVINALDEVAGGKCQKAWIDKDFSNMLIVRR